MSCDNTLRTVSFKFRLIHVPYEKTKGQVPLRPLLGKQNIQAKEVNYQTIKAYSLWLPLSSRGPLPRA